MWPETASLALLFALSFLLPAYTITGFDASANTAEETVDAAVRVPRGIVGAVAVSGAGGLGHVVRGGDGRARPRARGGAWARASFGWIVGSVLPRGLAYLVYGGIAVANYLCGLAAVTSASRLAYAFARDGLLPFSGRLKVGLRPLPHADRRDLDRVAGRGAGHRLHAGLRDHGGVGRDPALHLVRAADRAGSASPTAGAGR